MGGSALRRTVLAESLYLRQFRRPPRSASHRQPELLHRRAHRRLRLHRNRDLEFAETRKPPKAEVLRKFDDTIALVIATIEKQSESDWTTAYTAERDTTSKNRLDIFLRCASHLYHHIGQIIYLARKLQKS